MSLYDFFRRSDVVERLKPFQPSRPTGTRPVLIVPYPGATPQQVGTAFDYLLRFDLQRRRPEAEDREWVAERAPNLIYRTVPGGGSVGRPLLVEPDGYEPPPEHVARRIRAMIQDARQVHAEYISAPSPTNAQTRAIAVAALRLASLDSVARALKLSPKFETVEESDVNNLLELLAVVPFDRLMRPGRLVLNPCFVGADADLITGGRLVDVKTTQKLEWQSSYFNQLLGYYLLLRQTHAAGGRLPEVDEVGLYFSRFAHLWTISTAVWTERPGFPELERWWVAETAVPTPARPSAGASHDAL